MSAAAVSKLISLENSTRVRSFSSPLDLVRRRLAIMGALHQRCYYSSSLTNRISILQYFIKTMVYVIVSSPELISRSKTEEKNWIFGGKFRHFCEGSSIFLKWWRRALRITAANTSIFAGSLQKQHFWEMSLNRVLRTEFVEKFVQGNG